MKVWLKAKNDVKIDIGWNHVTNAQITIVLQLLFLLSTSFVKYVVIIINSLVKNFST